MSKIVNPVMILPMKKRISTELFTGKLGALYIWQSWIKIILIMKGCLNHSKEHFENCCRTLVANKYGNEG